MKTRKNTTPTFPNRASNAPFPQATADLNSITDNNLATANSIPLTRLLHNFPMKFMNKITYSVGNNNPTGQDKEPTNLKLKLLARHFLIFAIMSNLYSLYLHFTVDFLTSSIIAKITVSVWVISVILAGFSLVVLWIVNKEQKDKKTIYL